MAVVDLLCCCFCVLVILEDSTVKLSNSGKADLLVHEKGEKSVSCVLVFKWSGGPVFLYNHCVKFSCTPLFPRAKNNNAPTNY